MTPFLLEQTAYSFFGVAPEASAFEIQEAYRRLARKYPADRVWDTPMASAAKTGLQEVELWYSKISTPEARATYDAMLAKRALPVVAISDTMATGTANSRDDAGETTGEEASVRKNESENKNGRCLGDDSLCDEKENESQQEADYEEGGASLVCEKTEDTADAVPCDDKLSGTARDDTCATTSRTPNAPSPKCKVLEDGETCESQQVPTSTSASHYLSTLLLVLLSLLLCISRLPTSEVSPFETLGLSEDYSLDNAAIRTAYHRTVLLYHPDKQAMHGMTDDTSIVAINEAYQQLTDPYQRCLYETTQQTRWDPTGAVHKKLCAHLSPEIDIEVIYENDLENDSQNQDSTTIVSFQPAQAAVYQTVQSVLQNVWLTAWDAAGRLLCWLRWSKTNVRK
ncbi:hypothetical protein SEUCBS140593_005879 [Sporothrix eucalyptigena]|uniref:J domain-containing protein n=1 Tax=Sporothrix eucalyptigena TaxID=1812306 RepID=A0ABP0C0M2_9PEZI